jgi:hypothetical protein
MQHLAIEACGMENIDKDFELIANITGQRVERLAESGSPPA